MLNNIDLADGIIMIMNMSWQVGLMIGYAMLFLLWVYHKIDHAKHLKNIAITHERIRNALSKNPRFIEMTNYKNGV